MPAAELRERIVARSAGMVAAGIVDEVRALIGRGVAPQCRALGAVGYREAMAVVQGRAPLAGLAERIVASTWAYARRQRTWLRKEREVEHLDARAPALAEQLARALS
ncbi:MAG: hypothetical protein HYZ27_01160 [Deltaproteobacteria bacterium]|nr:hypothetical protein [Deltaproteobacteria bacterium]